MRSEEKPHTHTHKTSDFVFVGVFASLHVRSERVRNELRGGGAST